VTDQTITHRLHAVRITVNRVQEVSSHDELETT